MSDTDGRKKFSHAVMAEWLRRLNRNQMGSSCANSKFADCETFRSPGLRTLTKQKVRNNEKGVIPWEREKRSHKMADTDIMRESGMESWRSAEGNWIEIKGFFQLKAESCWLLNVPSTLINSSTGRKLPFIGICVKPRESKSSHSSSTNNDRHR